MIEKAKIQVIFITIFQECLDIANIHLRKFQFFHNVKMGIIRNKIICITRYRNIKKFVVIGIGGNYFPFVIDMLEYNIR